MKRSRTISLSAGLLALAVLAALVLAIAMPKQASLPVPPELGNVLLPDARTLAPFSLTDMNGTPFDLNSLQEKWTFVFFGYTHCPDICPTTLAILKGTATQLQQSPEDYRDARFVFISVDPKRDTLAHLKDYIGYFHPDFLAATGDKAQIDTLARQLGAIYMFDGDTAGDDYIVNHSANIALIDPQGRWVGRFNPPHRAAGIAEDYRRVRRYLLND
jgi:protein SCO1/2